jgi:hypothetical protein
MLGLKSRANGSAVFLSLCVIFVPGIALSAGPAKEGIVACVKIGDAGAVTGAFIVVSSGDAAEDQFLLSGIRNLQWGAKKAGETRGSWFPMGLALNGATPPAGPAKCAPPNSAKAWSGA